MSDHENARTIGFTAMFLGFLGMVVSVAIAMNYIPGTWFGSFSADGMGTVSLLGIVGGFLTLRYGED